MILIAIALFLLLTERVDPTLGVILVALAAVLEVAEVWLWMKYLKRHRVRTGIEAMIGERAVVAESCSPRGTVRLRGEIWNAESETELRSGAEVEVVAIDRLTLKVRPAAVQSSIS